MLNQVILPGKVLISLGDLLISMRANINQFREEYKDQRDRSLPIWNDGSFSTLDFVRTCSAAAFKFETYPISAFDMLVEAGLEVEYARDITFLMTNGIMSVLIDYFGEVSIEQLQQFTHIVMDDGMLVIFTRGVPSKTNIYQ